MKLLVIETKYFVDGHGEAEAGGERKFVTDDESYLQKNGKFFQYGNEREEEDLHGSEDSYNAEAEFYEVREINEIDAVSFKSIIDLYESL